MGFSRKEYQSGLLLWYFLLNFLLQGIFLTQGWNPGLLNWQGNSLPLAHQERLTPNPGWATHKLDNNYIAEVLQWE